MIGQRVSHYKILEKLGEGGMGVVYKAEDTKLKRTIALKFLSKEFTRDEVSRERFYREARAAAALNHPNIVTIYEIDEHDEQTYIAMECVEGQTLKDIISGVGARRDVPLSLDEIIDITLQICAGLAKAHQANIIHRDIKPQNILIDKEGRVKILDFGLAKLKGVRPLTKEAYTLGTTQYMSPEQAEGEEVDHRTDIWSLGVVLYEMITGQLPFKGEYEETVVYSAAKKEPVPLTTLRPGFPKELELIVNKALAKDPDERYRHIADMIGDLKKLKTETEKEMVAAPKKTAITSPKKSSRIYLTAAILLLAAIILFGWYFLFKGEKETIKPIPEKKETQDILKTTWKNSIAVLPFDDYSPQKDQEYFCDGMTDDIITKLTGIGELKVIARTSVMRYKNKEKDIKAIGKELNVATILEGSIRKEKDNIRVSAQLINVADGFHLWAHTYNKKLESVFDVQDEVSKAIAEALHVELSEDILASQKAKRPKNLVIYDYYLNGMHILDYRYKINNREEDFQAAVQKFTKAIEMDPGYIDAYFGLAYAYELHWQFTGETKEDFDMLISYVKKCYDLDPDSIQAVTGIAWINFRRGNYEKAFQHYKRLLELSPIISDPRINHGVGYFLFSQGLLYRAMKYFFMALEIDPFYFYSHGLLGYCFGLLRKFEQADYHFKKALEISPDYVVYMGRYSELLIAMNKYTEAEDFLAKVERIDPGFYLLPYWKALLSAAKGEKEKALSLYKKENWQGLQIYSLLGMTEEATGILKKLEKENYDFLYLRIINNSYLDNLRDIPRFKEIEKKAKIEYEKRLKIYKDF